MSKYKSHKSGYGHTAGKKDHEARSNSAQNNNTETNSGGTQSSVTTEVFFEKVAEGKTVKIGGAGTPVTVRSINKASKTVLVVSDGSLKEFHRSSPKVSLGCGASTKCFQATAHTDDRKLTLTFGNSEPAQRKLR